MSGPTKTEAYTDKTVGAVKENVGWAIGNEQMQAEGKARNLQGEAKLEAIQAKEYTKGTGEQIKGTIKEQAGKLVGNEQMQYEGMAKKEEGKIRKEMNS